MNKVVEMIAKSYVEVFGIEKWNNLTEQEQHDVIMAVAKDALNQIEKI